MLLLEAWRALAGAVFYLFSGRSADKIPPQVLAVDLLNPSPAAEAKKHKLKVR